MLSSLTLHDFRNYVTRTFTFDADLVVLVGPNGRGKTNVLEAISVLSVGRSWRESRGEDLILSTPGSRPRGLESPSALLEARLSDDTQLRVLIRPRGRTIERNGKRTTFKSHLGKFPTLLFAPEHQALFAGPKRARQQFFDRFLAQLSATYRDDLSRADRAARQKNTLLRENSTPGSLDPGVLLPWNEILADTIPRVWAARQEFLKKLQLLLQAELTKISGTADPIVVRLESPEHFTPTPEGVREWFGTWGGREIAAGKNLLAPARDDFVFELRDRPLTATASRGEERSVLLALLSAQKNFMMDSATPGCGHPGVKTPPVLLLDDCFSELDAHRQAALQRLCEGTQAFFTTTHPEHFQNFTTSPQVIEI